MDDIPMWVWAVVTLLGVSITALVTWGVALPYRKQAALKRAESLTGSRLKAYRLVVSEMKPFGDELHWPPEPQKIPFAERRKLAAWLQTWYFEEDGWLMSGDAFNAYGFVRATLLEKGAKPQAVYDSLSMLRTELKVDLGVREPSERSIPFATSRERTY
jgi:hypothetical protein